MWEELAAYQHVIMANGASPVHEIPIGLLKRAAQIICCDGAVSKLLDLGFQPDAIIGDGDSISPMYKKQFEAIFHEDTNPEYNDLNKALNYAHSRHIDKIVLLGASGLREDHMLANLGIMTMFAEEKKMDLIMVTDYGVFSPVFSTAKFNSYPGQQISIFSFDPATELTFHQLKYPVRKRAFRYLWEGSLNEAVSDSFTVEFNKGKVIVFRNF